MKAGYMWSTLTLQLVEAACEEDLGTDGDITSVLAAGSNPRVLGGVIVRQPGVICGLALGPVICRTFSGRLNCSLELRPEQTASGEEFADGAQVETGTRVATVRGPRSAVLTVERTLLNFLSRMSGVASLTRRFVTAARAANPDVKILDTRKTLPGWRQLDKYAVRSGGGDNHRFGLYDAILIKDNHLAEIPTDRLRETLTRWLRRVPRVPAGEREGGAPGGAVVLPNFVEVEVDNLEQMAEVFKVERVDVVLLDNFSPDQMRAAIARRDDLGLKGRLELEASGGVRLDNVAQIAATGVDRISVGALTHSAVALDIALDL